MIRVVIADDEEKVCQLIYNLISWKDVDMEIVGIAHNGMDALALVKELEPNLIITDIRMPGYDGLELISRAKSVKEDIDFIIISGYGHFEYAQSAIKYGVGDYLLKPIKKSELMSTLNKMKEKYKIRTEQLSNEEHLKIRLQNDIDKLRSGLFTEVLLQKETNAEVFSLDSINKNYHFKFKEGCYQVIIVKIDCGYDEDNNSSIKLLEDKIAQVLNHNLREKCFDMELYFDDCITYCTLNYEINSRKILRKQLKVVLDELLVQKNVFEQVKFTLGVGTAVETIEQLRISCNMAQIAAAQRLIDGTDKLIEQIDVIDTHKISSGLLVELNKKMGGALEIFNRDGVLESISWLNESIKKESIISGKEVFKLIKEACNMYLTFLRNYQVVFSDADKFYENFSFYANRCGSIEEIFEYLSILIGQSLDQITEDKKQADLKPIRIAKQYIQQNYMKPISLEEVSNYVGFNASYFSSLYKKETGSNFLEYLSEVRMNQAKELLKSSNLSISAICEKVGYIDLKHFTKSFKKTAGVNPNEYRKLYS